MDNQEDNDQPDTGKYQNTIDGESALIAREWLQAMELVGCYHSFSNNPHDVLKDYRTFLEREKAMDRLPERIKQTRTVMMHYPNCVRGSWGQYSSYWLRLLRQAECNDELFDDTLYDLQQRGFLPQEYTP